MNSVFTLSDWFLFRRISCSNQLRTKQDIVPFCFSCRRRKLFLINKATVLDNTEKAIKFCIKVFRDMYFFNVLVINALRAYSKCFVYLLTTAGEKPTFHKTIFKI